MHVDYNRLQVTFLDTALVDIFGQASKRLSIQGDETREAILRSFSDGVTG